ncbi:MULTISPECIES: carbohydrate ABC transporter permease [Burkholderia]|uniref:carbohydrate ABC transporter permease n=1 Tax=Burkholderia TaxID=32008 RepID=UPI000BF9CBB2|nr:MULTISPECIES: sugar ABC transporter permease [Burkholderia]PFH20907.1 carbohydrate ABC transporter membrane protein 1 (CUT1 family) [Burkholderia sp. JKS000303]
MKRNRTLLWCAVPALALYALLSLYPLFKAARMSLTDFSGVGDAHWIGLANYVAAFRDPASLHTLVVTFAYAAIVVIVQNGLGLLFAALLFSLPRLRGALRVGLLVPSMFSAVIAGFVWEYLYSPLGGGINELLHLVHLDALQQVWLGDPSVTLPAVTAVHVWMYVGYSTAIFLAGYLNIPSELHDAAKLDGANAWVRFTRIDLPLLAPAFTVNITLSTIGTLKTFELPLVLTNGGPDGATTTLGLQIFHSLFNDYKFGFASALSMIMLAIVVVVATTQNTILRRREDNL